MRKGRILIIDDDDSVRESLEVNLTEQNYEVETAPDGRAGIEIFKTRKPDLIITDLRMKEMDGLKVLGLVKEADAKVPVIVMTAFDDMVSTIKAMQLGAYDYIEKPINMGELKIAIPRALEIGKLPADIVVPWQDSTEEENQENVIVGKSREIKEMLKKIGQVSSSRVNVLIQGESGTGKELVSRVIHGSGVTKDFPFIPVDVSALPETLLESELFGHVKGAFTGATKDRKGRFELAGEGTVFLDEVSEISLHLQVKLLRVLQEREFERLGEGIRVPMRARIIAATNRNLEELVRKGLFREDLFYRISVFKIDLPPLRDRKEDIPALIVYLLKKINRELHKKVVKIPRDTVQVLQNHEWIGNIRELENVLMQAVVLAKGDILERENIIFRDVASSAPWSAPLETNVPTTTDDDSNVLSLRMTEKEHIRFVLDKTKWDKTEAAKILKVSRQTLYNKIRAYKIVRQ